MYRIPALGYRLIRAFEGLFEFFLGAPGGSNSSTS